MTDPTTLREALELDAITFTSSHSVTIAEGRAIAAYVTDLAPKLEAAKYAVAKRVAGREVCTQADVDETFITALRGTEE